VLCGEILLEMALDFMKFHMSAAAGRPIKIKRNLTFLKIMLHKGKISIKWKFISHIVFIGENDS